MKSSWQLLVWVYLLGICSPTVAQVTIQQLYDVREDDQVKDSLFYAYYEANNPINWENFFLESKQLIDDQETHTAFLLNVVTMVINRNPNESRIVLDEACGLAKSLGNKPLMVQCNGYRSFLLIREGNYKEALEILQMSLGMIDKEDDPMTYAGTLSDLANLNWEMDDLESARRNYRESSKYYALLEDEANLLINEFNLGGTYMNPTDYDTALLIFERVKTKAPDIYPILEAFCYGNIGQCLGYKGDFRGAVDSQLKGLQMEQENDQEFQMMDSHTVLGVAYGHLNKMDSSEYHFSEALRLSSKHELYDEYLAILEEQTNILALAQKFEEAFEVSQQVKIMQDSIRTLEVEALQVEMQEKFETEQKEIQNQLLTSQNRRQRMLLGIILLALLLCVFLLGYVLKTQRRTKRLNAQISAKTFALNQSNKTKDRLFSIIGHDLRGPITAFETSAAIIKSYLTKKDLSKVHEIIEHTDQSAKRLKLLLDNLLNWSLSQQNELNLKIEPLELAPLVQEVVEVYTEACEMKGISVVTDLGNAKVMADYNTFSTVLRNLLSNAIKFSPPQSEIRIGQSNTDQFIEITIEDKGIGIPEKSLKKLFSIDKAKVRKGTMKEQGSGLGLVLVKEFVALNHGELKLTTKDGMGTKFFISLPKAG